jgi:spermidine/putrescine-binding protein
MKMDVPCLTPPRELSRRTFLRTAASTAAGLAGILATHTPPLYAATRTLTMLTWNHFVPASDETLRGLARSFEKANKCQVKIDFIPHRDTYVKVAKEQETRQGHDQARAEWIVPNMFTFYVTGKKSLEDSVSWAEGELRRIYKS